MVNYAKFGLNWDMLRRLFLIKRKVYTKIADVNAEYVYALEPIPFENKNEVPLKNIKKGEAWSKDCYGCSWFHFTGKIPETAKGAHVGLLVSIGGEGCVMDDEGTPVVGTSDLGSFVDIQQPAIGKRFVELALQADGGEDIDLWLEGGNNHKPSDPIKTAKLKVAEVVTVRDDVKELYYDFLALYFQYCTLKSSDVKHKSIGKALKDAYAAAGKCTAEEVVSAREILKKEMENGEDSEFKVYATGHAHLDLAWLWPIRETQRKAGRTFSNQLRNAEKNPGYVFGASQPQQFEWMENKYPKLFEEIKEAVKKGTIEIQGGMWVECDTNVTGGESLIRQNLYGKRYWKEKFDKDMEFCWLPDVFGFSGNLPQILRKCGMKYFLTIKLSWNEHNKFPKRSFIWEGIDDSAVLVHMPPEGTYNSNASTFALKKAIREYPEKDVCKVFSLPFGNGDGGGGPSEGHIALAKREANMKGLPKVILGNQSDMFKELEKDKDKFDVFKGELYLEKHQGTYTTQAKNKFFNRKVEYALHNVEFLATAAKKFGMAYPKDRLDAIWKEMLLYQFHDIIPGSSIKRVYDETTPRYEKMLKELESIRTEALGYLKGDNTPSAVNTTSFPINDVMKYGDRFYKVSLAPYSAGKLVEYKDEGVLKANGDVIESDKLRVTFDKHGNIVSLITKEDGKEYAKEYLNKLCVYRDKRMFYDAWDIDINYTKKGMSEFKLIGSNSRVEEGLAVRENIYSYKSSTITQKVILHAGRPYVEFETVVDWWETHKMLRANFRPTVWSDNVTCDIQMGNIKRSTKDETSVEKAQFEICAHKYVDVSDNERGFSVFTDCKYGWRVKEGLMSLNLLRSPMFPAKNADKGIHNIKYALYPHNGNVYEADTVSLSYVYNNPPIFTENGAEFNSYVISSDPHVVVETVKMAENGDGVIVRAYEDTGSPRDTAIEFKGEYKEAFETDMLENVITTADLSKLSFKAFEIKTLLLK